MYLATKKLNNLLQINACILNVQQNTDPTFRSRGIQNC